MGERATATKVQRDDEGGVFSATVDGRVLYYLPPIMDELRVLRRRCAASDLDAVSARYAETFKSMIAEYAVMAAAVATPQPRPLLDPLVCPHAARRTLRDDMMGRWDRVCWDCGTRLARLTDEQRARGEARDHSDPGPAVAVDLPGPRGAGFMFTPALWPFGW